MLATDAALITPAAVEVAVEVAVEPKATFPAIRVATPAVFLDEDAYADFAAERAGEADFGPDFAASFDF